MTTATPVWTINTLDRSLPDGTVTTLHWTVSLTEDDHTASAYGSIGLPAPDPDDFMPYEALFPGLVIEWLRVVMGEELMAAYETSLVQQIEEKRNPTHATGLPWS
jgi:hypothetical protein